MNIATINPAAVDTKASLIPPVTPTALISPFPKSNNANDFINPRIVPSKPNKGETVIIVENKLSNFFISLIDDCIAKVNAKWNDSESWFL